MRDGMYHISIESEYSGKRTEIISQIEALLLKTESWISEHQFFDKNTVHFSMEIEKSNFEPFVNQLISLGLIFSEFSISQLDSFQPKSIKATEISLSLNINFKHRKEDKFS